MLDFSKPKIVASLTSNLEEKSKEAAEKGADAVEVRLDLYEGDVQDLDEVTLPVISTCRPKWEGGNFPGTEKERIRKLKKAMKYSEAVDIEREAEEFHREVKNKAKKEEVSIIVSSHNFERTPEKQEMISTLESSGKIGDIAKLAVKAEKPVDSARLLQAASAADTEVAAMAMGESGSYTRFVSPIHNSKITYASLGNKTAPGQLSVDEIVEAYRILGIER